LRGTGSGPDDPTPESQRVDASAVVYDDSPGFPVTGHLGHTWVHCVQNFTGWVEGRPRAGVGVRRLTEVVAWHSVVSVIDPEATRERAPNYQEFGLTRSGTGWSPTEAPTL
jgi:hypothetical protein